MALENNLELLMQRRRVAALRLDVSRQKTGRYPALDLTVRGNREKSGGSVFGGGSDLETANVALRLSLPLFQGGFATSRVREAFYRYQSASTEMDRIRLEVDRQARVAHAGVMHAMAQVEARRQALSARRRVLDARRDGYVSGASSSLDVLDAERRLFQAQRQYSQARYDYILNSLRLKLAVGQIQEADLIAINRWLGEP